MFTTAQNQHIQISMMKSYLNKLLLTTLTVILASGATPVLAQQVNYRGLVIRLPGSTEAYLETRINPGDTYRGEFILQHDYEDNAKEVKLYIDAADFYLDTETGETRYDPSTYDLDRRYSLAEHVRFDREEVVLNRYGQEEKVQFVIQLPSDMLPGTRYANILVSDTPTKVVTGQESLNNPANGASIASRVVAATLIMHVGGNLITNINNSTMEVTGAGGEEPLFGLFYDMHPLNVRIEINNTGNFGVLPGGDIYIHTGDINNAAYTNVLNSGRSRVLPESKLILHQNWQDSWVYRNDNGFWQLSLNKFPRLNWGSYLVTAKVLYRDDENKLQTLNLEKRVFILPWRLIAVLLVVLIIIGLWQGYKRRERLKAWKNRIFSKNNKNASKLRNPLNVKRKSVEG